MNRNFAVMDIGSNTVRLVLFETSNYIYFKKTKTFRHRLRLRGYVENGIISEEGIKKLTEVLTYFKASLSLTDVSTLYAFATATIRDAKNGAEILKEMNKLLGLSIKILSAKDEAYYGFLSVVNATFAKTGITVDMGGGSTEIVAFENRECKEYVSFPFGSLSLSLDYIQMDKNSFQISDKMPEFIETYLQNEEWLNGIGKPIVAMGGSARSLAKIHMNVVSYPISFVHQYVMTYDDVIELYQFIKEKPIKELVKMPGLNEERLETLIPSIGFFKVLMEYCQSPFFIVSSNGIREGFCYSLMEEEYGQNIPNVMEDSIHSLSNQYQLNINENIYELQLYHSLSKQILDSLGKKVSDDLYKMGSYAIQLYNFGAYVSDENSLRHTFYILTNTPLHGFAHKQQIELALLASFKSKQKMLQHIPDLQPFFNKDEWLDLVIIGSVVRFIKELTIRFPKVIQTINLERELSAYCISCNISSPIMLSENDISKITKPLEKLLKSKIQLKFS